MEGDLPAVPPALRAAYEARCQAAGLSLSAFVDEVRGDHPAAALRALLDEVEAEVLENIALMASARPDLEPAAGARAEAARAEFARLRARLGGGG